MAPVFFQDPATSNIVCIISITQSADNVLKIGVESL